MTQQDGWFSSTGAEHTDLTDEQQQIVEERRRRRGQLLGVVQVRVYEHECEPYITFPHDAVLGVDTNQAEVAEMVARARSELMSWR